MKQIYILILLGISIKAIAQINLSPYTNLWTESWPQVIKIADVNNDGLNDVILGLNRGNVIHPNDYSLLIYYQNAGGVLSEPVKYSFEDNYKEIISIDIGDLNQDGMNDILIGMQSPIRPSKYGIFYQNVNHTFNDLISFPVDARLECARIGDINNDGINDIVISTYNKMIVARQTAAGNFQQIIIPKTFETSEMKIADMNNDGKKDIVILWSGGWKLYTFFQQNTGFATTPNLITNVNEWHNDIAIDDLNNDGQNDIVLTRSENYNSKIKIIYQNNGVYASPVSINAYELPEPVEIADLNNDGRKEIVAAHGGWINLSVFTQNSSGSYGPYNLFPLPYATNYDFDALSVGDINNDGKKDIVVANYNRGIDVLYNTSTLGTDDTALSFLKVWPNPATDILNINGNKTLKDYKIFDTSGKIISQGTIKNNQINVDHLSIGKYFLRLSDDKENQKITYPFLKK